MGLVALAIIAGIAWNLGSLFDLDPQRAWTGGLLMMFVAVQFAFGFPFGVFGAVVNGFQRTYLNSMVGIGVSLAVVVVNVAVVLAGGSLVQLVAALTLTRMVGFLLYRVNAYRVFPLLRIRPTLFRWSRMREMAQFSVYMLVQDVSTRVNYAADPIVIAAFLSTGAVAVWTVAQRLADVVLQLTNQFNYVLFPVVVDCDTAQRDSRLRDLLLQGTRLSLATTLPIAGSLIVLAEPVIIGWTGSEFRASIPVLQLLTLVVLVRVGSATASTVLQGAGHLRLLSYSNFVAAAVNVALSVVLIRTHGLPGVAVATLMPVLVRACAVPDTGCVQTGRAVAAGVRGLRRLAGRLAGGRRVGLPDRHATRRHRFRSGMRCCTGPEPACSIGPCSSRSRSAVRIATGIWASCEAWRAGLRWRRRDRTDPGGGCGYAAQWQRCVAAEVSGDIRWHAAHRAADAVAARLRHPRHRRRRRLPGRPRASRLRTGRALPREQRLRRDQQSLLAVAGTPAA